MTANSNIMKAIASFQSLGLKASKDGINPHFKKRYPTLLSIMNTIRAPLAQCGLHVTTRHEGDKVITSLVHPESGESIESWLLISPQSNPQQQGSAITYFRRYSLMSMLDLLADEDDDANLACDSPKVQPVSKPQPLAAASKPKEPFESYLIDTQLMQFISNADQLSQANGQPFEIAEFLNYYYEITPEQIATVSTKYYGR